MLSKSAVCQANKRKAKIHGASQSRSLLGKFLSNSSKTPIDIGDVGQTLTIGSNASDVHNAISLVVDLALLKNLINNSNTTYDDKLARAMALYAQWRYEDKKKQALERETLMVLQKSRCQELRLIVFDIRLYDTQVKAICTLFYEQRDFLLLAKKKLQKKLDLPAYPFHDSCTGGCSNLNTFEIATG